MSKAILTASRAALGAEKLLAQAWDESIDSFTNLAKIAITRLRRKLGQPDIIHTTPAVGSNTELCVVSAGLDQVVSASSNPSAAPAPASANGRSAGSIARATADARCFASRAIGFALLPGQ